MLTTLIVPVSYTHLDVYKRQEEDIPAPVNYYGYTKWKGEEKVAETCSSYAIVRVAIGYGRALPGQHGNIVQLVMNRLKAGQMCIRDRQG